MRRALPAVLALAGLAGVGCAGTTAPDAARALDAGRLRGERFAQLTIATAGGPVDVALVGENLEGGRLDDDTYCGGREGARVVTGRWRLVSTRRGAVVSDVRLPEDVREFIEGTLHDGLRAFDAGAGQMLVLIYQYAGCSHEEAWFLRLDPQGRLHPVSFHDRDGREWQARLSRGPVEPARAVFCTYDRSAGIELCDTYAYDGVRFVQVGSRAPSGSPDRCSDEERPTAWEFFTALVAGDYGRAAYHYAGPVDLAAYCVANDGRCALLDGLDLSWEAPPPGEGCRVTFIIAEDRERFPVFWVRVRRVGDRDRVFEIPPRIR